MILEDELTAAYIEGYGMAGQETGYWGYRFLQAVKRSGGTTFRRRGEPRIEHVRGGPCSD